MARLNKKLWEAWQNGYIYSIWATSRSTALRALKSKYGGKFTRIRQYPGIGKENPRRTALQKYVRGSMKSKRGYIMVPATRKNGRILPRRGNVAAGFVDEDGQFHPIRASFDYNAKRAGEGGSTRKKSTRRKLK